MPIHSQVLYVDDEAGNCEMMKYYLESELPVKVITEPDGRGAMNRIGKEFFDVYILDYGLPDTTGIELCKWIRTVTDGSKIIIYSALDRPIDKRRALVAGADKYFVKPNDIDDLKIVVAQYLDIKSGTDTIQSRTRVEHATSKKLNEEAPEESLKRSTAMRSRRKCSGIT